MMYLYKQNESVAARRRVYIHLVDATDGITAKTGQTGTGFISKNGGTPVATSASLTEIDSMNQPGLYYIELLASELDTLGFMAVRFKNGSTAEFQMVGQVVADDPYIQHTGPGLSLPSGKSASGMKKEDMVELAKMVWNVILKDKETAKDVLLSRSDFDQDNDTVKTEIAPDGRIDAVLTKLDRLDDLEKLDTNRDSVLDAIAKKEGKDYTKEISAIGTQVKALAVKVDAILNKESEVKEIRQLVKGIQPKLEQTHQGLDTASALAATIKTEFDQLHESVNALSEKLQQEIDIEKRMERVGNKVQDKAVLEMVEKFGDLQTELRELARKIMIAVTDSKYDLMKNNLKP